MATIIDSLVVTLGLDASKFTEGQRQADSALRSLESGAERTGARFGDIGVDILAFLKILEAPSRTIRRHLESIAAPAQTAQRQLAGVGAQARRTSVAGEAGLAGLTVGVRALSVAGLAAIGVFEAMKKTIEAATASATKTFGVGIGAAAAGTPVQEFSAIGQALLTHGNVPEGETQNWLAGIKQFQENLLLGQVGPQMQALGKLGINPVGLTPEQVMEQLALKFAGESDVAQVISQGASVGLSQAQSVALRNAGANLPGEIAEARRTAVSPRDVRAANELLNAENKLGVAWEKLSRDIWTDLDPGLTKVIAGLTVFVTWLDNLNGILNQLGAAETSFSAGIGQLEGALSDLFHGNFAKALNDLSTTPAKPGAPHPGAVGGGQNNPGNIRVPGSTGTGKGAFQSFATPEAGVAVGGGQNNPGNIRVPGSTGTGKGAFQSFATPEAGVAAIGDQIDRYQGRGINTLRGVISKYSPPSENDTAALIANASRRSGFGPDEPLNFQDPRVRGKVVGAIIMQEQGRIPPQYAPAVGAMGPGMPIAPPPGVQGMLQSAQHGALAMNSSISNSNDNSRTATAHVGQIVVNTASTDPRGVVRAIREAVNRNLLVGQANSGLA